MLIIIFVLLESDNYFSAEIIGDIFVITKEINQHDVKCTIGYNGCVTNLDVLLVGINLYFNVRFHSLFNAIIDYIIHPDENFVTGVKFNILIHWGSVIQFHLIKIF